MKTLLIILLMCPAVALAERPPTEDEIKLAETVCSRHGGVSKIEVGKHLTYKDVRAWSHCKDGTIVGLWRSNGIRDRWGRR